MQDGARISCRVITNQNSVASEIRSDFAIISCCHLSPRSKIIFQGPNYKDPARGLMEETPGRPNSKRLCDTTEAFHTLVPNTQADFDEPSKTE